MHEKLPATSFMMRTPCVKLLEDEWPKSITPHDVRQTCLTPAWHMRKLLCASCFAQVALCELQCMQVALRKLLWARCSAQTGLRKLVCASCSAQVARCKLLCASCSAQVAPCKLLPASGSLQVALCKLLPASCSLQVALCKLLCASCSVQVALRKLLCASCSRQGALCKLVCASCSAQVALRKLLYASCSAQLAKPARGLGGNRTHDPPVRGAGARATRQLPRTTSNNKSRKKPRVLNLDHADPCAATAESVKNQVFAPQPRRTRKKPRVFAPRPGRSPQRVARAC